MDSEYGVKVSNKFSALDDEDSEPFGLAQRSPLKEITGQDAALATKKNDKKSAATGKSRTTSVKTMRSTDMVVTDKRPVKMAPRGDEFHVNENGDDFGDKRRGTFARSRGRSGIRSENRFQREAFGVFGEDNNNTDGNQSGGFGAHEDDNFKKVSMRGGRGAIRQGGRGRPAPVRGRQFDRQSGAGKGIRAVGKREGFGSYNWGTTKDELVGETEELATEQPVELDNTVPKESLDVVAEQVETEEKPDVKELTLDEWRAKQGPRVKPQFNTRKAGEGESDATWNSLVPLERDVVKTEHTENKEEFSDEPQVRQRKKEVLEIGFTFRDVGGRGFGQKRVSRGGGGPGGRGSRGMPRGRGSGPRKPGSGRFGQSTGGGFGSATSDANGGGGGGFGSGGGGFGSGGGGFGSGGGGFGSGGGGFGSGGGGFGSGGGDSGTGGGDSGTGGGGFGSGGGGFGSNRDAQSGGFGSGNDAEKASDEAKEGFSGNEKKKQPEERTEKVGFAGIAAANGRQKQTPYRLDEDSFPELPTN